LVEKLIAKLEAERQTLAEAALSTYEAATHEESEAEDQYDTRGLEASYLAGAQAKRVADVEQVLHTVRNMNFRNYTDADAIGAAALVQLDHDGKGSYCLLLPQGGGMTIDHDGYHVQVITPQSPLGEALLGRTVGDVAVIDVGNQTREYEIISIS
jgi:transcription elongation GreA/GreB family factor